MKEIKKIREDINIHLQGFGVREIGFMVSFTKIKKRKMVESGNNLEDA